MKKLLLIALLMLALVFTVVACTDTPAGTDTTAADTTVETPTEAPTEDATTEEPTEEATTEESTEEITTEAPTTEEPTEEATTEEATTEEITTEEVTTADPADPVYVIDADAMVAGTPVNNATVEKNDAGYASFTATGGDPWVLIAGNIGEMPEYLAISYRTNTNKGGEFFLSNGANPEGGKSFTFEYNTDGKWNLLIFHLPTVASYMTDATVGHIRFDFFRDIPAEGTFLDVAYIAFFNTAEYAEAYEFELHKAPAWNESGVVTHLSFDQLYTGNGDAGNGPENFFTPGQSGGWDHVADVSELSVDTITFWGWVGVKGEIGQFGYQINGGTPVYDDAWTFNNPAEGLINHCPAGTDNATRMKIAISLQAMTGTNTIRTLYKAADGTEACLAEFTVVAPDRYLGTDKKEYVVGETIMLTINGLTTDEIAFYPVGHTPGEDASIKWGAFEDSSEPAANKMSSNCTVSLFDIPAADNQYNIYVDANGNLIPGEYKVVLRDYAPDAPQRGAVVYEIHFTVVAGEPETPDEPEQPEPEQPDSERSLATDKEVYIVGETIMLTINGLTTDEIAFYPVGHTPGEDASIKWGAFEDSSEPAANKMSSNCTVNLFDIPATDHSYANYVDANGNLIPGEYKVVLRDYAPDAPRRGAVVYEIHFTVVEA